MSDCDAIRALIATSSRMLGRVCYAPELIEAALQSVLGLDTQLVQDRSYYLAETSGHLAGCGGWSRRRTLFGSDAVQGRDDSMLDPAIDAARIRAFFVHPDCTRRGVGTAILAHCERAARHSGFRSLELGATLSGVEFYRAHDYLPGDPYDYECAPGLAMTIVPMRKELPF